MVPLEPLVSLTSASIHDVPRREALTVIGPIGTAEVLTDRREPHDLKMSTDAAIRATAAEAMAVLADIEHWLGPVAGP